MKPHRTDWVSLIFAMMLFLVLGAWLVSSMTDVSKPDLGWLFAGALILFGVIGLFGTRRPPRPHPDGTDDNETES